MAEWIKVNIIENAHMPLDHEDINLKKILIDNGDNYYEIAISKTMKINYIMLVKNIVKKETSERLQFSVHINCRESMVNIFKEHMASEKKKGGWCIQEEWNFWDLSYKTCSLAYKFMNDLRIRLLLINENDNQQALKMARELERYIELLIKILESENTGEVNYCKSKSKSPVTPT